MSVSLIDWYGMYRIDVIFYVWAITFDLDLLFLICALHHN